MVRLRGSGGFGGVGFWGRGSLGDEAEEINVLGERRRRVVVGVVDKLVTRRATDCVVETLG